jgi:PAS domain S-box-containing protein
MTAIATGAAASDTHRTDLLVGAFNAAPNGFIVIDASGTIVATNRALEAMFGYAPGALLGSSIELLLPEAVRRAHVAACGKASSNGHAARHGQPDATCTADAPTAMSSRSRSA